MEYLSYHLRSRLVNEPLFSIFRRLFVAVWNSGRYPLAVFGFAFPNCTNLLAGLLGIPLVENVVERHHLQTRFGGGIHILLDRNEGHAKGRIDDLCQPSHFHLLTTKTTKIFYDNRTNQAVLYHFLHLLKPFPLEGSTGYAVIYKELRVPKALPTGEVL